MNQSKQNFLEINCAFCCLPFEEGRQPLIFCKNAHLCCEACLILNSDEYQYASFLCPLCLCLACKATATSCTWLTPLLANVRIREELTASEKRELLRQNHKLKEELEISKGIESNLKMRLQELERRKNKFSQNWKKAIHNVVSKRSGDSHWSNQQLQSFEKCPQKLLNELDRLYGETKRLQTEIEKLKRQKIQLATRVQSFKSENDALELNWSGTYMKPIESTSKFQKSRVAKDKETELVINQDKESKSNKIQGYFTSNLMEIFKQKIKNSEQTNIDKRSDLKNRTCKKYLNMKIEDLDEKFTVDYNPKFSKINSNLKRLRDVFDIASIRKKQRTT